MVIENKDNHKWYFYELGQAADELKITIFTLFQYINQGKIKMIRNGGRFKIRSAELYRFQEQRFENMKRKGRPRNNEAERIENIS